MSNTRLKPTQATALILNSTRRYCMATLRKERFPSRKKSKLMARGDDRYEIVQRVEDNAYKIELSGEMNITAIFNIGDLTHYIKDEDLRVNPLWEGGLCGGSHTIQPPQSHEKLSLH